MHLFEIKIKGKYGFINAGGEIIIKPQFEKVMGFNEGLAFACLKKGDKETTGFINQSGEWAFEPVYSNLKMYAMFVYIYFSEGMAPVQLHDTKGMFFINKNGDSICEPIYQEAYPFSEGRALVKRNGLYGYIDATGKEVIECQFGEPVLNPMDGSFSERLAVVRFGENAGDFDEDDNLGYIDKEGKTIFQGQFLKAAPFSEGYAMVTRPEDFGEYFFINKAGEIPFSNTSLVSSSFSEGFAPIYDKETECLGYINETDKWAIKPQFKETSGFSEGLAVAEHARAPKKGYINKKGELAIKNKFYQALSFKNGLAWVQETDKSGYINNKGEYVWHNKI